MTSFQIAKQPELHFGWGIRHTFSQHLIQAQYRHVVLISSQFIARPGQFCTVLLKTLQDNGTRVQLFTVSGEPSPDLVDAIVKDCSQQTQCVIGIGGGSVLDAAKSIAGLIPSQTSVMDYLEGVGKGLPLTGETLPFIALPTTAGTGSETTKNAVLSRLGLFKKSFRSEKLLAQQVWLDPEFLTTCPQDILYTTGLDAFTQLLESYTTLKANPITDALAWQGMTLFKGAFELIQSPNLSEQQQGYGNLMLAASLSGTTLANAGLGAVHGLAGPIGAFFDIPHGAVCANLLAPITKANIDALQTELFNPNKAHFAAQVLNKYQKIGELFTSVRGVAALEALVLYLNSLTHRYISKSLSDYGLNETNFQSVLANCRTGSMLGNPVTLSDSTLQIVIK
jgi:alcohol dehydrogenase class IV